MRITLSVLKADVGSVGGHTRPSDAMLAEARRRVAEAKAQKLIIDGYVSFTGDDIALTLSHTRGELNADLHQWAWKLFHAAGDIAKEEGNYGWKQDLLVDAPAGTIRGAGPAVAELSFEHNPVKENKVRPAEAFTIFAADKCGPGAYNLPLTLAWADPMYCSGLLLSPKMTKGFTFRIIDMNHTEGDRIIELQAPEDLYLIAALLRDNDRFAIEAITSRMYPDQQTVVVSAQRLHNISGTYSGKDDPVAIARTQGIFPASEEIPSPWALTHYVGGGARGSHVMPIMPVPINTPVTGNYNIPLVSALAFSMNPEGKFSHNAVDFFGTVAWDLVRIRAQEKALIMRSQGWSGAAMLPYSELEYGGIKQILADLDTRFQVRKTSP